MVSHMYHERQRAQAESRTNTTNLQLRKWCQPPPGWIEINVDATYQIGASHIRAGCVIRDYQGQFIGARAAKIRGGVSSREAEALSFKETLRWIKNWRTNRCIFELDAKMVVDAVNGHSKNSNFHGIIDDCREIIQHFEGVLVVFEHRSANRAAYVLAKAVCSMSDTMEWFNMDPNLIYNLIAEESYYMQV